MDSHRSRRTRDQATKSGTPIIDRSGLPDGLGSSRETQTSIEAFSTHLRLHARNSQNLVSSLNLT